MKKSSNYIPSLTSLRGIAALLVCLYHYDQYLSSSGLPRILDIDTSSLINKGYLWVDFFFILSGFVVCHVYGLKLANKRPKMIKSYLWARFSRLYPLHLFILTLCVIQYYGLVYFFPDFAAGNWWINGSTLKDFFLHLFLLQTTGISEQFAWNLPSWSIAAEWWTYIVAIALIPFLNNKGAIKNMVAITLATCGLYLIIHYEGDLDSIFLLGSARCLFEFTIGIGVYQFYKIYRTRESIWSNDFIILVLLGLTTMILHFGFIDLLMIPLFALLILSTSLNKGSTFRILNTKPLLIIGDISYSIYLIHSLILMTWSWWLKLYFIPNNPNRIPSAGQHAIWISVLFITIIFSAYITYRFIEVPARKKLRSLVN